MTEAKTDHGKILRPILLVDGILLVALLAAFQSFADALMLWLLLSCGTGILGAAVAFIESRSRKKVFSPK